MSSQYRGNVFTTRCKTKSNVLRNKINICTLDGSVTKEIIALWDTGATNSVIRPEIAKELNLPVVSTCRSSTPSGVHISNQYYVNVVLPNNVKILNILVAEGIMSNCHILIGMDIIGRGDFAVSNYEDKTTFSFRIPSQCEIDFIEKSYKTPIVNGHDVVGRNEKCPCGSGKKYKKCCLNKV